MGVNLTSGIWDPAKVTEIASRSLTRLAKIFKQQQKDAQVAGPHTGIVYESNNVGVGVGFTRVHQASAWGERPAPDTFNLVNSLEDEKTGPLVHSVYVDDSSAPYGKWLQNPSGLNRPIANQADADAFKESEAFSQEILRAQGEMAKGGS